MAEPAGVLVGVPKPNRGFELGAAVEAEAGGAVAVVVVPFPRPPANILEAGAAEVVGPPNNEGVVVTDAAAVVDAWVPGVLAAADGKLKAGFGTSEAGAVVEGAAAPELAGVEEGVLRRAPGVEFVVPLFRPEKRGLGFGWVESAGFAPVKRVCWPIGVDPNKDLA